MSNSLKLKALAIFVCSSMAGFAMADDAMNGNSTSNGTQNGQMTTQPTGQPATTDTTPMATQPMSTDDTTVTNNVKTALSDYSGTVTVTVTSGIVYLEGQLPSDTDYEKVVTLAESVKGTKDVNVDKLTVKDSTQPLQDTYITGKVKGALIQADIMGKDIPSWTVSVETKNGTVYLSGTVANEQEKQSIVDVVQGVKGVSQVDNQLVVGNVAPANGSSTTTSTTDTTGSGSDSKAPDTTGDSNTTTY